MKTPSNFNKEKTEIRLEANTESKFDDCASEAVALAVKENTKVVFFYQGTDVTIDPATILTRIRAHLNRKKT